MSQDGRADRRLVQPDVQPFRRFPHAHPSEPGGALDPAPVVRIPPHTCRRHSVQRIPSGYQARSHASCVAWYLPHQGASDSTPGSAVSAPPQRWSLRGSSLSDSHGMIPADSRDALRMRLYGVLHLATRGKRGASCVSGARPLSGPSVTWIRRPSRRPPPTKEASPAKALRPRASPTLTSRMGLLLRSGVIGPI